MGGPQEIISIVKVRDSSEIYAKVKEGFESIGSPKFDHSDTVVIKPNLCGIKGPETGATTDPKVVEGLILYLQKQFGTTDITIVESDGTQVLADMAFKLLGFEKLAAELNVKLVNLSQDQFSREGFDKNVFLKKIIIPQTIRRATWLISIPKIKTHTLCSFGGTMKNQYGCNPYPKKRTYHSKIHDAIVDLNVAFKPDLVVVDGIVAMEGSGPVEGVPVRMNTLIFGRDAVAIDYLMCKMIGINPERVKYLVEARKRGLGTTKYETVGINPKEVARKFRSPPGPHNLYGLFSRRNF